MGIAPGTIDRVPAPLPGNSSPTVVVTAPLDDGPTGTGVHRFSLAAGDWIQLNGLLNLFQANRRRGRPYRRLAAGGDRDPSGLAHHGPDPDHRRPGLQRQHPSGRQR